MWIRSLTALAFAAVLAPSAASAGPAATASRPTCDRACLMGYAEGYMKAMLAHDVTGQPLSSTVKVTENLAPIAAGEGLVQYIKAFKYPRQFVVDTAAGQIGVQAVVDDLVGEALLGLRLKVEDGRITEIETLVTHEGEGGPAFQPVGFLTREGPFIRDIPLPARTSRADLLKVAKAYWTAATKTHDRRDVPYDLNCLHIENGMNTDWEHHLDAEAIKAPAFAAQADGRRFTCGTDVDLSTTFFTGVRSYRTLVDEERGLVMVWNVIDTKKDDAPFPPAPNAEAAAAAFAQRLRDSKTGFGPDDLPPGLTMRGMAGSATNPRSIYHAETQLIINGKIVRHQQFLRDLPLGQASPWPE